MRANLDQHAAERSYSLTDAQLTPVLAWNLPALRRAWDAAKPQVAPWWPQPTATRQLDTGVHSVATVLPTVSINAPVGT
ncbi:hypothetical protein [Catellatospora tritici]|uniref:hypothetical protein n=1 Tax=Catellatospora tritici TaxID=2851566 RepID=UPI001C2DD755|nr:hypothetical protein [Catellatospora tritici]MBV1855222.1 hypothetical protein [Catellatospora tritici]